MDLAISDKHMRSGGRKILIISPQAGLGNRLRAINSAIILAEATNRDLYHCWHSSVSDHSQRHVNNLKALDLEDVVHLNPEIPMAASALKPTLILSEWGPKDSWFLTQSTGQSYFNTYACERAEDLAKKITSSDNGIILVETSRRFWPKDYPGITYIIPAKSEAVAIQKAYQRIQPQKFYLDILGQCNACDAAIAIRTGDLLKYSSKARFRRDKLEKMILQKYEQCHGVMLFADDDAFLANLYKNLGIKPLNRGLDLLVAHLLPHQKAMTTFFYMAMKSKAIYGTPGSSFAQEASLYGGVPYYEFDAS